MVIKDESDRIVSQDPILFTKPLVNSALPICKRPGSTAILKAKSIPIAPWLEKFHNPNSNLHKADSFCILQLD